FPPSTISDARPASPIAMSWSVASFSPAALPPRKHTATNTTQAATARHGCSALHRANRTVTGRLPITGPPPRAGRAPTVLTLGRAAGPDIGERPRLAPDPAITGRPGPVGSINRTEGTFPG